MGVTLGYIGKACIMDHIGQILPHIEEAMDYTYGEYSLDYVVGNLLESKWDCILVLENHQASGVFITNFVDHPNLRSLSIILMGGLPLHQWETIDPLLTDYARLNNCKSIECLCRNGVKKMLMRHEGIKHQYNLMVKEV